MRDIRLILSLLLATFSLPSWSMNVVFGPDIGINGMKVGASYIQAVMMMPMTPGMPKQADIHLETDVHALKGNPQGFPKTAWIPGLHITYQLTKLGSNWHQSGDYLSMVAQGGPHYGINIKLDGPGRYQVVNHYYPPTQQGLFTSAQQDPALFAWWQPFIRTYQFDFFGAGKHGGY